MMPPGCPAGPGQAGRILQALLRAQGPQEADLAASPGAGEPEPAAGPGEAGLHRISHASLDPAVLPGRLLVSTIMYPLAGTFQTCSGFATVAMEQMYMILLCLLCTGAALQALHCPGMLAWPPVQLGQSCCLTAALYVGGQGVYKNSQRPACSVSKMVLRAGGSSTVGDHV